MRLNIVDAFTTKVFGGNPAGVVLIPEGGDFPDDKGNNVFVSQGLSPLNHRFFLWMSQQLH